jgi:outer membrane protein
LGAPGGDALLVELLLHPLDEGLVAVVGDDPLHLGSNVQREADHVEVEVHDFPLPVHLREVELEIDEALVGVGHGGFDHVMIAAHPGVLEFDVEGAEELGRVGVGHLGKEALQQRDELAPLFSDRSVQVAASERRARPSKSSAAWAFSTVRRFFCSCMGESGSPPSERSNPRMDSTRPRTTSRGASGSAATVRPAEAASAEAIVNVSKLRIDTERNAAWRRAVPQASWGAGVVALTVGLGVGLGGGSARAEAADDGISLAEALARAESHHPDLPAQAARVDLAKSRVTRAQAGRYPKGELRSVFGIVNGAQVGALPEGLGPEFDPLRPLFSEDDANDLLNDLGPFVQNMVRIDQAIHTFGKIRNGVAAARSGVEAETAELSRQTDDVRLEVKRIYYGYQLSAQLVGVMGDVEANFAEALEQARARLDDGTGEVAQSDVLKLEIAKNGFARRRLELERQRAVSLAAFRRAVGAAPGDPVRPASDRIAPVAVRDLAGLSALREEASGAPAVRAAELGLDARQRAAAVARSQLWPDIFAGVLFEANWALRRDDIGNPFLLDQFNIIRGGPFLGVRWDLDFATKIAAVQEAEARAAEQRAERDRARTGVPLAVERAYLKLEEKREGLAVAERSRKAGRGLSFLTAANFRMGIGDAREILESYGLYVRAASEYYRAIFEFNMAAAELSQALGEPVEAEL